MDAEREARIAEVAVKARPLWAEHRDSGVLQEFLKEIGCDSVDAVMVTRQVVKCSLGEAQEMFLTAPCRATELAAHNALMDALERSQGAT
ncbi:hypothetical protein CP980_10790 [Streptomyces vinaceus]|uniref:Uncharacterized protein n=1 Tax=Streptomyces vinaceus TaxID=1960 RepID=A0A5J6J4Q4_STRVI|nr:hypothetical protein [Streptomyces vinaceus]QEV45495.1 hypothetical protein CP980_10790 [Streptomyces vinaceus]GHE31181.1 hypothetical protein GCM10017778_12020 [Streptomyces vinaceus]